MSIYDFKVKSRTGKEVDLSNYRGKVLIIVNTATGCGFSSQYEGLEELYKKFHNKGLEILDFPCNQFGNYAPGTDDEIHQFCTLNYKTTFDQFQKIDVNGQAASPLYTYLKKQKRRDNINGIKNKLAMKVITFLSNVSKKPGDIKWNFTKFVIDKDGKVVGRYSPTTKPKEMRKIVKSLLVN